MKTRTVEQLIDQASCYAAMACKNLLREFEKGLPPGDQEDALEELRRVVTQLKTHYLFPNLTEGERALLETLAETIRNASSFFDAERRGLRFQTERAVEQNTNWYEARFRELKKQIARSSLLQKLTDPQRLILERYFLQATAIRRGEAAVSAMV